MGRMRRIGLTGRRVRALATVLAGLRVRTSAGPGYRLGRRVSALPRMVLAMVSGRYTGRARRRSLLVLALVVGYVLSPVDLLPEAVLLLLGLGDDLLVLAWLAARLVAEVDAFLAWERSAGASSVPLLPSPPPSEGFAAAVAVNRS